MKAAPFCGLVYREDCALDERTRSETSGELTRLLRILTLASAESAAGLALTGPAGAWSDARQMATCAHGKLFLYQWSGGPKYDAGLIDHTDGHTRSAYCTVKKCTTGSGC